MRTKTLTAAVAVSIFLSGFAGAPSIALAQRHDQSRNHQSSNRGHNDRNRQWVYRNGQRHGYYDNHRRYHRWHPRDRNDAVAAGFLGFVLGSAIAGSAQQRTYYEGRRHDRAWIAYCSRKYRSFDPASGTYLGYDGYRHYCQ